MGAAHTGGHSRSSGSSTLRPKSRFRRLLVSCLDEYQQVSPAGYIFEAYLTACALVKSSWPLDLKLRRRLARLKKKLWRCLGKDILFAEVLVLLSQHFKINLFSVLISEMGHFWQLSSSRIQVSYTVDRRVTIILRAFPEVA